MSTNYKGNGAKFVSSSYLYKILQNYYGKLKNAFAKKDLEELVENHVSNSAIHSSDSVVIQNMEWSSGTMTNCHVNPDTNNLEIDKNLDDETKYSTEKATYISRIYDTRIEKCPWINCIWVGEYNQSYTDVVINVRYGDSEATMGEYNLLGYNKELNGVGRYIQVKIEFTTSDDTKNVIFKYIQMFYGIDMKNELIEARTSLDGTVNDSLKIKMDNMETTINKKIETIPKATRDTYGVVKATSLLSTDTAYTDPIRINNDGNLYTKNYTNDITTLKTSTQTLTNILNDKTSQIIKHNEVNVEYLYCTPIFDLYSSNLYSGTVLTLRVPTLSGKTVSNMTLDTAKSSIHLKKKKYRITIRLTANGIDQQFRVGMYKVGSSKIVVGTDVPVITMTFNTGCTKTGDRYVYDFVYESVDECDIQFVMMDRLNDGTSILSAGSSVTIVEIPQKILVDPLEAIENEEVDTIAGSPVGSLIDMIGTVVPSNYLICNGATYNISDYPKLAEVFTSLYGSSNYFGGDGIDTFAVPVDSYESSYSNAIGEVTSISGNGNGVPFSSSDIGKDNAVKPWNAFNSSVSKYCLIQNETGATEEGTGTWDIGFNFKTQVAVSRIKLTSAPIGVDLKYTPYSYKIQGSNDGAIWDDLHIVDTSKLKDYSEVEELIFNNTTPYYSYRILVTTTRELLESGGTEVFNCAIGKIQMFSLTYSKMKCIKALPTRAYLIQPQYKRDSLWSGNLNTGTISLSDGWENYEIISFSAIYNSTEHFTVNFDSTRISEIKAKGGKIAIYGYDTGKLILEITNSTSLKISSQDSFTLSDISGIGFLYNKQ